MGNHKDHIPSTALKIKCRRTW